MLRPCQGLLRIDEECTRVVILKSGVYRIYGSVFTKVYVGENKTYGERDCEVYKNGVVIAQYNLTRTKSSDPTAILFDVTCTCAVNDKFRVVCRFDDLDEPFRNTLTVQRLRSQ